MIKYETKMICTCDVCGVTKIYDGYMDICSKDEIKDDRFEWLNITMDINSYEKAGGNPFFHHVYACPSCRDKMMNLIRSTGNCVKSWPEETKNEH